MALGFIGNFELIPEKCVLKLELFVNSENLNSKVQSDNKNDNGTDYKAAFRKAVRSMSEIGNGLSLIGAFLTFFTLISFSKLRKRKSNLIICILCISVAAVNILNFAVQRSADYPIPCLIVAILSHFFLLSKIIWMTILAFHLYFELIKVYSTVNLLTTSKLILITTVIGFGIPILVVGIAYIADGDKIYGRNANGFCWMNAVHADALFIYPMLALVGVNFVIFILIFYQVRKLSKDRDGNFTLSQMRALMALVTALGLAWIFVLLTYIEKPVFLKNIAEVLFVVCTSLQGFFLYYFYCVSKDEVRACYMKLFGYQPLSQTQSGTSTKPTNGSSRNLTRIGRDLRSYHSEKSISPSVSTQKIAENTTYKTNLTSNDTTKRGSACSSLTGSQLEKIEEENIANAEEAKEVKSSAEKAISSNDGNSGTVNIAFEAESASSKSTNEDEITFEGKKKEKRVSLQINGKIEFPEKSVELTIEEVKPEIQIADASKEYDITANDDRV
ncbi:uncharacterized protein TRIADDRAFT_57425 [Trichoplax adhaerens]|uniref:G-protein coupled receptors family 2 profile 2 domain-containing protein n=1 Tax=Trichoplax adhaerens TaxID=10228 RepID=B3RZE7_TRIAD|nr:hypothetical protein TRIADDRAFT_57425 [Trichoplax adhaerens]EDV23832.1 hypothetical protein TRIADDRAFT_57425 [Trichoplax adhaerens]|eukprot:XP_002113358.1 hypothetical protein TRIADDRAFT_57425 [Trichoplax adhaerens]